MERTAVSQKEFARGGVLARVAADELTLAESAPLLGVSYRQAKRLYAAYRARGSAGLVHGNVGRRSNRARQAKEKDQVLALVEAHYGGPAEPGPGQRFGPSLASEHLRSDHSLKIPVSTLREWMLEKGLWTRARKRKPAPRRRERRAHFGELVQMDGSFHDWYEGRGGRAGERSCMMNMVDDATGRTLVRFGDQETIWAAVAILQLWISEYGVPRALYTDWKNVYKRAATGKEQREGIIPHTQFGRMCTKLGIHIIAANTPQAKGRVERSNGIQQDRLIKKMRLAGIEDDASANDYVRQTYLPALNARYAVVPAKTADYHLPRDLRQKDRDIFCLEHPRTVSNDYVVQYGRLGLQLDRSARGHVPARSKVIIRETPDGELRVIHVSRRGEERACAWVPVPSAERGGQPTPSAPTVRRAQRPNKPAAGHPWRREGALATARKAIEMAELT